MLLEASQETRAFDARAAAEDVAFDMQAAFQLWTDDAASGRPANAPLQRMWLRATPEGKTVRRGPAILAALVGLLVGVSLGTAYAPHGRGLVASRSPSRPVRTLSVQTAQVTPPSSTASASPPYSRLAERPSLAAAGPAPATAVRPAASYPPPPFRLAVQAASDPSRLPANSMTAPPRSAAGDSQSFSAAARQPRPAASLAHSGGLCSGAGIDRPDCLNQASFQADQDLRRSYQDAIAAGVPNETLQFYTRAWRSLRQLGASQPDQMVLGYRRLAATMQANAERVAREDDGPNDDGSRDDEPRGYGSRVNWPDSPPNARF